MLKYDRAKYVLQSFQIAGYLEFSFVMKYKDI